MVLQTSKDQKFWEKKKYVEYYLVLDHGEVIISDK